MNSEDFLFALGLTFFAGLSTGIGSLMAFLSKNFNPKFLAGSLGFSEGIAVSVPIYFATKSRKKTFFHSFLSGLAEPVGAIIGYFLLLRIFNEAIFGIVFAGVAGIMIYISLDELLPTAE